MGGFLVIKAVSLFSSHFPVLEKTGMVPYRIIHRWQNSAAAG
jgi:hypothetical protein